MLDARSFLTASVALDFVGISSDSDALSARPFATGVARAGFELAASARALFSDASGPRASLGGAKSGGGGAVVGPAFDVGAAKVCELGAVVSVAAVRLHGVGVAVAD